MPANRSGCSTASAIAVILKPDVFEQRMEAIKAYTTQFHSANDNSGEAQTYISTPDFLESVIARARMFGKRIGVKYAEGFITEKKIGIHQLDSIIQNET